VSVGQCDTRMSEVAVTRAKWSSVAVAEDES